MTKVKYPTWVKSQDPSAIRSMEERDGTPDFVLHKEGNKQWRMKRRNSAMSEYFESKREALEHAGGTLTVKEWASWT